MKILLGIGGGIAAYKSAELARLLIKRGDQVQVVMTAAAQEFVQPLTFATLTGNKVITGLYDAQSYVEHIEAARANDILLIAPATAGILGKLANGLADDFLSTLYLAFAGQVVLAPSMNDVMWNHAAVQQNLRTLASRGARVISPESGYLACGSIGPGRLAEPSDIVAALQPIARDLEGQTVLITAGPTREPIDPVRFFSNRSSGKMGFALAAEARERGASVTLIAGPVTVATPVGVRRIDVETAQQMHDAVFTELPNATVVVKCAAVADFRMAQSHTDKLKKASGPPALVLESTPDILGELGQRKGSRLLIGFAAETGNLEAEAVRKAKAKQCDLVIANRVGDAGTGFDADENEVVLAFPNGTIRKLPRATKTDLAGLLWTEIAKLLKRHAA